MIRRAFCRTCGLDFTPSAVLPSVLGDSVTRASPPISMLTPADIHEYLNHCLQAHTSPCRFYECIGCDTELTRGERGDLKTKGVSSLVSSSVAPLIASMLLSSKKTYNNKERHEPKDIPTAPPGKKPEIAGEKKHPNTSKLEFDLLLVCNAAAHDFDDLSSFIYQNHGVTPEAVNLDMKVREERLYYKFNDEIEDLNYSGKYHRQEELANEEGNGSWKSIRKSDWYRVSKTMGFSEKLHLAKSESTSSRSGRFEDRSCQRLCSQIKTGIRSLRESEATEPSEEEKKKKRKKKKRQRSSKNKLDHQDEGDHDDSLAAAAKIDLPVPPEGDPIFFSDDELATNQSKPFRRNFAEKVLRRYAMSLNGSVCVLFANDRSSRQLSQNWQHMWQSKVPSTAIPSAPETVSSNILAESPPRVIVLPPHGHGDSENLSLDCLQFLAEITTQWKNLVESGKFSRPPERQVDGQDVTSLHSEGERTPISPPPLRIGVISNDDNLSRTIRSIYRSAITYSSHEAMLKQREPKREKDARSRASSIFPHYPPELSLAPIDNMKRWCSVEVLNFRMKGPYSSCGS